MKKTSLVLIVLMIAVLGVISFLNSRKQVVQVFAFKEIGKTLSDINPLLLGSLTEKQRNTEYNYISVIIDGGLFDRKAYNARYPEDIVLMRTVLDEYPMFIISENLPDPDGKFLILKKLGPGGKLLIQDLTR